MHGIVYCGMWLAQQHYGEIYCLHLQGRNAGNHLPDYTVSLSSYKSYRRQNLKSHSNRIFPWARKVLKIMELNLSYMSLCEHMM
jgi:hypothetical protein